LAKTKNVQSIKFEAPMTFKKKKISVIIPVFNDPSGLKDTLNSLVKQNFPKDSFEIIVADNGSTDSTLSVIKSFMDRYPKLIRMVTEKDIQSSYAARNKAIKEAKASIISFIDSDMTVETDWLRKAFESLQEKHTDCLVCNLEILNGGDSILALYDKMIAFPIEKYVREKHFTPTGCLIIYKYIFNKIGLFDSNLISGGDHEFGNRLYEAGYEIRYEPNIVMKHPTRSSLRQLLSKAFRLGRGFKQRDFYYPKRYRKKYNNLLDPRNFLPKRSIFRFTRTMRGNKNWDEASCIQRILFYFIYWVCCLGRYFGYSYESLRMIKKKKTLSSKKNKEK
jgi:glycosyltransferase involved in cell wall biosynthesis